MMLTVVSLLTQVADVCVADETATTPTRVHTTAAITSHVATAKPTSADVVPGASLTPKGGFA